MKYLVSLYNQNKMKYIRENKTMVCCSDCYKGKVIRDPNLIVNKKYEVEVALIILNQDEKYRYIMGLPLGYTMTVFDRIKIFINSYFCKNKEIKADDELHDISWYRKNIKNVIRNKGEIKIALYVTIKGNTSILHPSCFRSISEHRDVMINKILNK